MLGISAQPRARSRPSLAAVDAPVRARSPRAGRTDRGGRGATPGLALAGAAYRGVGIPDCIRSGEDAAEAVVARRSPRSRDDPRGVGAPVRRRGRAHARGCQLAGARVPRVGGTPFFVERGEGAYLVDVDGNRYVDYVLSWAR